MTEQQQLLQHLSEECHEVSAEANNLGIRAVKASRFGMDEIQAGQDLTNAQRILKAYYAALDEFHDMVAIMEMIFEGNDAVAISSEILRSKIDAKKAKVLEWRGFAKRLEPETIECPECRGIAWSGNSPAPCYNCGATGKVLKQ